MTNLTTSSDPTPSRAKGSSAELPRSVEWGRHAAVALVLATLAFMQEPGRIVPDTKIDLVLNPIGLLQRALTLWEPLGFGGQVQNQGYGYLFPMGPFFVLGDALGVPEWVWQRLWWTVLLFAAYLGAYLLASALGIGSPGTRLVGGLAFALAPRMLATMGAISSESLAMAVAPWVVLPLVWASADCRWARGGLLSGVALLFAGGINAAATLVLCVPPAIYLITRAPGSARRRLTAWWLVGTALACIWWLGPLFILRQVSPPFLDYIEDASITTRFASLPQALRGTEHWLPFLADASGPVWRSGWFLVTVPIVILYTSVVAGLGLAGVSLRTIPERTFIGGLTLVGLVLVTWGYVGGVDGLASEWARTLLDGPLVAFRNTHKFDPILRLALALGLMHLLARASSYARGRPGWGVVPGAISALALLGVLGTAFPAYIGQLAPRGSFDSIPGYWEEAAGYLEEQTADGGRVLLAPGTAFANYLWGSPRDEPIQALARVPWITRDAVPLTPPATIRALDALQARWATGRAAPGMADQLAAMGVRYLVIRNDLDTSLTRAPAPAVVHEALRGATGLRLVADFGPLVGGQLDDGAVVDRGLSQPYRAIEIYEVEPYTGLVSVAALDTVPVVAGGPENVVDLRDAGIVDSSPTLLDRDATEVAVGPLIQTDGVSRRESTPGRVDDNMSARLEAQDPGVLNRRQLDYEAFPEPQGLTVARWTGEGVISASSAASDVNSAGGTRRSASPASGLDGDLFTSWWSGVGIDDGPWWMVEWSAPRLLPDLRVAVDQSTPLPRARSIIVTTSQGSREYVVPEDGVIEVPATKAATSFLRIAAVSPSEGDVPARAVSLGLREILGLPAERRTAVVTDPSRAPDVTVVSAAVDGRPSCVHPPAAVICTDLIARTGEEDGAIDRVVSVPAGAPLPVRIEAVARPGTALDELIASADAVTGSDMVAAASSSGVADPEGGPRAAIDRDLETAWIAGPRDPEPRIVLRWRDQRSIGGLQLRQRLGLPASRPLSARVTFPDGEVRAGVFDERGVLAFDEPVAATSMVVEFPRVQEVYSVDPATGAGVVLPVGVADLRILGAVDLQPNPAVSVPVTVPCGQGPVLSVGDLLLPTQGRPTSRDLVQGLPVKFTACGDTAADVAEAGAARILATGGDRWSVRRVVLGYEQLVERGREVAADVVDWGATHRRVAVPPREGWTLLVVRENANPGWTATMDGAEVAAARPDGWQQGWLLPPGDAAVVDLRMAAAGWYRAALVVGLLCALMLVTAAIVASRRGGGQAGGGLVAAAIPRRVLWGIGAVGMIMAAGVWGAGAWAVAWVVQRWLPKAWRAAVPASVGILVLASGVALAAGPWPSNYAGDALLPSIAVVMAVALAVAPEAGRRRRDGRSGPQATGGTPLTPAG
jgi:arabinofuranan 3-O-arabinosyltransferase